MGADRVCACEHGCDSQVEAVPVHRAVNDMATHTTIDAQIDVMFTHVWQ